VDLRRLRVEEWLAGALGAVLVASLFLHWYGTGDAWESFRTLDVLLTVVGLMGIAIAVLAAAHRSPAVPTALATLLGLVGLVVTALLVYRTASPPVHAGSGRGVGLWVGLFACAGATLCALVASHDQRSPRVVRESTRIEPETLPAPPREGTGESGS